MTCEGILNKNKKLLSPKMTKIIQYKGTLTNYANTKGQFFFEPCPFGLIKRLDPVVVIFFQKMSKKLKVLDKVHFKKTGSANTFFWK